jgi:hypothetical protein
MTDEEMAQALADVRDELVRRAVATKNEAAPVITARNHRYEMEAHRRGLNRALSKMKDVARSWADTAAENDRAMGRRDPKPSDEQKFVLSDILRMINDAASDLGAERLYGVVK